MAAIRPLLDTVRADGADHERLLRGSGIDVRTIRADEPRWLPASVTDRLWQLAADATPDLPLRVAAAATDPSAYGLLTHLLACHDTVGSALEAVTRYYALLSEATTYRVERGLQGALLELDLHGPRPACVDSFAVAVSLCWLRAQAVGPVVVREARFTQPRPDTSLFGEHARLFGARLCFGSRASGYVLDRTTLAVPLRGANSGLRGLLEEHATRSMTAPSTARCAQRVRDQIAARGVLCSIRAADVAADLGLSERTLRRLLRAEGTSFQAELDRALADVASERLVFDSVEHVALSLGFSDAATFRRAFRRWYGAPPRAVAGAPPSISQPRRS